MTLRYCGLLSLSFSGNLIRLTATYVITCVQKPTLAMSSSSAPQVNIALVTSPSLPSFALRTYVLQEEGN